MCFRCCWILHVQYLKNRARFMMLSIKSWWTLNHCYNVNDALCCLLTHLQKYILFFESTILPGNFVKLKCNCHDIFYISGLVLESFWFGSKVLYRWKWNSWAKAILVSDFSICILQVFTFSKSKSALALTDQDLLHTCVCYEPNWYIFFFYSGSSEVRFPINIGITGTVATTGEVGI